ncbi:MAG: cell division protein FtsL [Myxococcales bacterium]|jgi:cell division protein FtsL|nr:cell division protein FtsL [Myxococcales bacterium]
MSRSVKRARTFLVTWTLAVLATVSAFVVHLALRGRTVSLGYELGRARAEQARLRDVKRVLELEAASYKTPERVDIVARTLLGMEPPSPDRVVVLPALGKDEGAPSEPIKTAQAQEGMERRP